MLSRETISNNTLGRDITLSYFYGPIAQGCRSLRSFAYSPQSIFLGRANSFEGCYNLEHICIPPATYTVFHKDVWTTFNLQSPEDYANTFVVTDNDSLSSQGVGAYRLQSLMWPGTKSYGATQYIPPINFNMLGNVKSFSVASQYFMQSQAQVYINNPTPNKVMAEPAVVYIKSNDTLPAFYLFEGTAKLFPDLTEGSTFDQFKIYVDSANLDAYKTANGWKDYADYIHAI